MFPRAHKGVVRDRLPSFRVENEYDSGAMPKYFQVCINVLEARQLVWSRPEHANSFVILTVGSKRRRTAVKKGMEQPFYREYFVFEMLACPRDVQRTSVSLAVMEPRCCAPPRTLGQAVVDLSAVWNQPHHQIFHKWAQLTLPKDASAGPRGFLKVDITILCRGEVQYIPPAAKDDTVEENLMPPSNSEQQRANYLITVYKAWGLPSGAKSDGGQQRNFKPPSTFVRITFCGLVVKTSVQPRSFNPSYNEQISITEMFPNVNQHLRIEVCSVESYSNKVLCSSNLCLDDISHDGENGFLPTFGPGPVHMYGDVARSRGCLAENGPYYRGALIMSFRTLVPYYQEGLRSVNVEPTVGLDEENIWVIEDFYLFFPVLEVSMIDKKLVGRTCGIAITMADMYTEKKPDEESQLLSEEIKTRKAYYTGQLKSIKDGSAYGHLDFGYTFPVLQLLVRYPDYRTRVFRNNMVTKTFDDCEVIVSEVEKRLANHDYENLGEINDVLERALDDVYGGIQKFLDIEKSGKRRGKFEEILQKYSTELEDKRSLYQKNEMIKIQHELRGRAKKKWFLNKRIGSSSSIAKSEASVSRKLMKLKLADTKLLIMKLKKLQFKSDEGLPDIVVWLVSGSTRVAYVKISAADVMFSAVKEQCGKNCAKFQTMFLKPIKCPKHLTSIATGCVCVAAKIETSPWFGLLRQKTVVPSLLPGSYEVNISGSAGLVTYVTADPMYAECRAFIYRAKLSGGADSSGLADPFVRMNIFNQCVETQVKYKCLTPVWNQVLRIQNQIYSSPNRFSTNPATVLIEVYDSDLRGKTELMGRVQIQANMSNESDYKYAPKLQWFQIFKGPLCVGQILMSLQLLQVNDISITQASKAKIETLPASLMPECTTYKIDVYWWGLRGVSPKRKPCAILEIDDLTIKSEYISENKSNCNFPNGRYTQTFEAPLQEAYCPPLSIRLYDSGTFGRTVFLGTNVLKSPSKFIVDWIPKFQRDASLHSASFETNQELPLANRNVSTTNSSRSSKPSDNVIAKANKPSRFFKFFGRNQTVATVITTTTKDHIRLPLIKKPKEINSFYNDSPPIKDWWIRFSCSEKDCLGDNLRQADKIVIYKSELEIQEEFSNFKDWCHTLKLYRGKKTGIPEEDEKLYCGFLKTGIAIYKWPPPNNMVAVTSNGVDLDRGFFHDHPSNESRKYLVRVYIIKGYNLMPKDFSGKSDPYVLAKCGKKQLGDRKHFVPKNLNPIFGRFFEFRAVLPDDYQLTIFVYDYDRCSCADDLIGSTTIDIEDRIYSKYRASCGLASEYCISGYNKWRDCFKPSAILEQLCHQNNLPAPVFPDSKSVLVNGIQYKDYGKGDYVSDSERKENVCLNLLKKWHTLPVCGHHLVPEHVETRTLFNPEKPGLDQGKLQMWVDIFPLDSTVIPPAVVIKPRRPEEYELRVIIWDVEGVTLDEYDIITGEKASDIYVKAWIGDPDKAQTTDIHYRSLTGEGNFNWRMIFQLHYQQAERRLVFPDTYSIFGQNDEHVPPALQVIVMDNDFFSADDYLGSLTLNLDSMPRGSKTSRNCNLANMAKAPRLNLFNTRCVRGWWPFSVVDTTNGKRVPRGKVDLEAYLLTKEKASMQPAGLGREAPQPLALPKRPETSYNIFTSPLASIKRMAKRRGWKSLTIFVTGALLTLGLFSGFMALPRILLEKLIG